MINFSCLATSISLSVYFFYSLSENLVFRFAIVPVTVILECLAQLILSKARFFWRQSRFHRAFPLFFAYLWYLVVFALFSGMSFFVTEIDLVEKTTAQIDFSQAAQKERWAANERLLATLNLQLETEAVTGYGPRSRSVMEEINRLKREQTDLGAAFTAEIEAPVQEKTRDTFGAVAGVLGIAPDFLKVFVFGTVIMFVYLGLTLTNWEINFEEPTEPATETEKKERRLCPVCGDLVEGKKTKIYCSDRCRRRAWEERQEKQERFDFDIQKTEPQEAI